MLKPYIASRIFRLLLSLTFSGRNANRFCAAQIKKGYNTKEFNRLAIRHLYYGVVFKKLHTCVAYNAFDAIIDYATCACVVSNALSARKRAVY